MLLLPLLCTQLQLLCSASPCSPPPFLSRDPPPPLHLPWTPPPTPTQTKCAHMKAPSQAQLNKVKCCYTNMNCILSNERKWTCTAETIPYLESMVTDLPSPSLLFSHFTGRYWFPVLFFLLHVLVGPHLLLIQQAGSLEFSFLPDKLQTRKGQLFF